MKTAFDIVNGKIVDVDEHGIVTIKAQYDDYLTLIKRKYKDVKIQMVDGRPLSCKQRNACYALIREIADYSGMTVERTKETMKFKFLSENIEDAADNMFSLSNAPMSLVCAFQRFLVGLIIDYDIPCSFPLLDMVDDVGDYIYRCCLVRKCVICGTHADIHHMVGSTVGMGGNRDEMIHLGSEVLPICRVHHNEIHQIGEEEWKEKYHLEKGVIVDEAIAKANGLNMKEKRKRNGT